MWSRHVARGRVAGAVAGFGHGGRAAGLKVAERDPVQVNGS